MKALRIFYLVVGILAAANHGVLMVRWAIKTSETPAVGEFILFAPAALCFGAYVSLRRVVSPVAHGIAVVICLVVCTFGVIMDYAVNSIVEATAPVRNLARYDEIFDRYWSFDKELTRHFPRPIPTQARDVRFYSHPSFLQGGATIQLRYSTPPEDIAALYDRFAALKTKSFFGGNSNDHMNASEGMPTTAFYSSDSEDRQFPDDYEIMVFDKVTADKSNDWNHGTSHGVAISKQRNEIVYWAEAW